MQKFSKPLWIKFLLHLSRHIDAQVSRTGTHSANVAQLVQTTALKLRLSSTEVERAFLAAMVHDIGKISVPTQVLSKQAPLSDEEWVVMKLHPVVGANIVQSVESLAHIAPIINSHQEKFDGTGYPQGLKGEAIPISARILCVADAYEAMTEDRVYRTALSPYEAAQEIQVSGGKHFDPLVAAAFLSVLPIEQPTPYRSWALH